MGIKLIASDMDGTLLNDKGEISQRNAAAIRKAIDAGVIFTIATGRMYCSIEPFAEKLGLDVPLIAYNGAFVKGALSKEVLHDSPLDHETSIAVLEYCKKKNYYVQAYVDDTLLVKDVCEFSTMYANFARVEFVAMGEKLYRLHKAPHKLLLMTESGRNEEIRQEMTEKFGEKVSMTNSFNDFLEVINPSVSKWNAVKALAQQKGIDLRDTMCIGDSNNDFEMVANAGIGVAVANANDRIREAAKLVTAANNEDGVALAIENILTQQIEVEE
ncbi:MAG: HAD family phosphatase [Negativicutes bacterium]|nr:HAD family phosphatase [Negativicutes bacterium]